MTAHPVVESEETELEATRACTLPHYGVHRLIDPALLSNVKHPWLYGQVPLPLGHVR